MKRISLIALMFLGAAGFAAAQLQNPTTDVLGAHLNYGRGCAACHAPHSGALGNGKTPGAGTDRQLRSLGRGREPTLRRDDCLWRQQVHRNHADRNRKRIE